MGIVFVKDLTTSESERAFNLLKRSITAEAVRSDWKNEKTLGAYNAVITPLTEVLSAHEQTRQNYLKVNILDRYYMHNDVVRHKYFASGSEGAGGGLEGSFLTC